MGNISDANGLEKSRFAALFLGFVVWSARLIGLLLVVWGVALGAWVATALAVGVLVLSARRRGLIGKLSIGALTLGVLTLGSAEVLWKIDRIGERSRAGDLSIRDQVGVYGFNAVFGASAIVLGFPEFGVETLSMGLPISLAGSCPEARLRKYRKSAQGISGDEPVPLRRWHSDFPMRSPRFRTVVRRWSRSLPTQAKDGTKKTFGPTSAFTWRSKAYFSTTEANGVPVALNAPTTVMEGVATREGDRWKLDLVVHLAVAYPKKATMKLGPFSLEEGMWYDSRSVLRPYCGEYVWSTWADSPDLEIEGPQRTLRERGATWVLRKAGVRY